MSSQSVPSELQLLKNGACLNRCRWTPFRVTFVSGFVFSTIFLFNLFSVVVGRKLEVFLKDDGNCRLRRGKRKLSSLAYTVLASFEAASLSLVRLWTQICNQGNVALFVRNCRSTPAALGLAFMSLWFVLFCLASLHLRLNFQLLS